MSQNHRMRGRAVNPVLSGLMAGLVEWGLALGVGRVVCEMHPLHLLTLIQLHFQIGPLGLPEPVGGEEVVALTADFEARTLRRLREIRNHHEPVLQSFDPPANRRAA